MIFQDTLTLDAPRKTAEGFLVATVRAARTGIQEYSGREVDPENKHGFRDRDVVRVYRDENEVFHVDSLRSFSILDVTVDHPPEPVTARNWREFAVGVTGEEVVRDGEFLRIPLMLKDAAAIEAVERGKNQLSVGYDTKLVWESGETADGLQFDAKQTKIRANHLSIVGLARGGPKLKIGDSKPMKTIVHDGIAIEFPDQAADAYNALSVKMDRALADAKKAKADADAAIAAADAKAAKAEAERDAAQAKILDDAAIDARVAARAALISTARAIHDAEYTGSDSDIRKAVVVAKLGDAAIAGKSEAYIDARFDILADEAKAHGSLAHVISAGATVQPTGQNAIIAASFKAADSLNDWRNAKN